MARALPPDDAITTPLVVDLDGTLIASDLLVESAIRLLRRNPLYLFLLPIWLLRGRHVLKHEIAQRIELDPALLPYNEEFLAFVRAQHRAGRQLVLATASTRRLAEQVFAHLRPLFGELLCSDAATNLKGSRKRDALVERFGHAGFDYAGNGVEDLHVWRSARRAIVVHPSLRLRAAAARVRNVDRTFASPASLPRVLLRSMRPHQWMKNLLVFLPLLAAHKWGDAEAGLRALAGFASFCLLASGVYQINDILDVENDRAHPRKRHRPVASGELSIIDASLFAVASLAASLAIAWSISPGAFTVLLIYALTTSAYSWWLKTHPIIDVVALAFLYTIRIVGGAAAIGVVPSYWLLSFSMFMFLSLAMLKRCAELVAGAREPAPIRSGRGYVASDLSTLTGLGTALGVAAVLVLALYINADVSARNYTRPEILWLLCPVLVYWLSYLWLKTGRGEMHDDPIVFAMRDRPSLAALAAGALVMVAATV